MSIESQHIPDNPAALRRYAEQLQADYAALDARHKADVLHKDMMITKLRHQLFGLRKDKFGSSGEGLERLSHENNDLVWRVCNLCAVRKGFTVSLREFA